MLQDKDRIDRAIERHQRHELDELKSRDCDFHRQILFDREAQQNQLPPEGERVTAEVLVPIVRNGFRRGDTFITDQNEEFKMHRVENWITK